MKSFVLLLFIFAPVQGQCDTDSQTFNVSGNTCSATNEPVDSEKPCEPTGKKQKSFFSMFKPTSDVAASAELHYKLVKMMSKEDLLKLSEATKNIRLNRVK